MPNQIKMKMSFEKSAGIALIAGTVLLVLTMVLHPSGGSLAYLLKIAKIIIISHSIALLALPFLAVGFWGLTKKMGTDSFFSVTAFSMVSFALIAGMIAAAMNGLALPFYIQDYKQASPNVIESLKPIVKNNLAINHAFDFIFIGAMWLAVLLWSIEIILTRKIPVWIGFLGMALFVLAIVMLAFGFVFVNLHGFRIFVLGTVIWIASVAMVLVRSDKDETFQQ